MISDITLGQYFPGRSFLHRLDPRTKTVSSLALMILIFCAPDDYGSAAALFVYSFLILFTLFLTAAGRIRPRLILRSLRPLFWVIVFTGFLNLFFTTGEGEPLFAFWIFHLYRDGIWRAVLMAFRVLLLIAGTSVLLTYTTSPIQLTDGLESLFSPLKIFRAPVHEFAMTLTIALRFIPTLIEESERIIKAQKSRGADFSSGGLIRKAKALIPILVPLFVTSFQHAMNLATAMECRCYHGGDGRSKFHELRFGYRDLIMTLLMLGVIAVIVCGRLDVLSLGKVF